MPTLRCIKHDLTDRSVQGFEVDLAFCDKEEIERANLTYKRICEVPCEHYKWRSFDAEVKLSFLNKISKIN